MKTIHIKCAECKNPFERPLKEHKRSLKLKRLEFCSGTCSVTYTNKHMSDENRKKCGNKIKTFAGNRKDDFSPFRQFLNRGSASLKTHHIEIDVVYLKGVWDKQQGICPYTGIKMLLPKNTKHVIRSPKKASLDRIDSSKDYIPGNVEFVCCAINLAKNSFTREQMKEFLSEIVVEPRGVEPLS